MPAQMGSKFPQIGMKMYHMLHERSTLKGIGQSGGGGYWCCVRLDLIPAICNVAGPPANAVKG